MTKGPLGTALPPLLVGAMNRTLSLIPSRHAALQPAPPPSRHVVGVKPWGVGEKRAEIRDHPPSPPVSIASVSVGIGQGGLKRRTGWLLSFLWREKAKMSVLCGLSDCFSLSPSSSRCVGLPLQTARGPLLASASREPVGLQGRETGRNPRVFKTHKKYGGRSR